MFFELVVLTIQTVEGTGMVEHGQVVMAMLRPFKDSIRGVATARAARTNKVSHAVGGKRVIIIRKIALVRTAAFYGAALHSTKSAEAYAVFRNSALVHTELAGDASLCPGRVFRKTIRLPAAIVHPLDFRPHFLKIGPDTIYTEANYSGDRWTAVAAMTARAQAKAGYSFADAGHDLPILRIDLLTYQICKIPNPKLQITNYKQTSNLNIGPPDTPPCGWVPSFNDLNGLGPRI